MAGRRIARKARFPLSSRKVVIGNSQFLNGFGLSMVLVGMAALVLIALQPAHRVAAAEKVTICHATGSQSNPYIANQPNASADVQGHDDHDGPVWYPGIAEEWGDIIPPFDYDGGSYPGKNWTPEGQAIYNNGCNIPSGTFTVFKDCSPNVANCAATISLSCTNNATDSPASAQATESAAGQKSGAVFEVENILPSTTCTATESNVSPGTYTQSGTCNATLNAANNYIASCTITNTVVPLPSGTFSVEKNCNPNIAGCQATISVSCDNGASDSPASGVASETDAGVRTDVDFTISNISTSTTCTATESNVSPANYTQTGTCNAALNAGNSYTASCVITNTEVTLPSGTFSVEKDCNPSITGCQATISVSCNNGASDSPASGVASETSAGVRTDVDFTITNINGSTLCTATESNVSPAGYTQSGSCNATLNNGNSYTNSCVITNTVTSLPSGTFTVTKDCVPDVSGCSATISVSCTGTATASPPTAVASETGAGVKTSASFVINDIGNGTTQCTGTESNVQPSSYTQTGNCNADLDDGNSYTNGCTITNNVLPPDISISKQGTTSVDTDGAVSYTITITNNGSGPAVNVFVGDNLPDNWTNVSGSWDPGANPCAVNAGNNVVCTIGTIAGGASVTVNISAIAAGCDDFTNTATIAYGPEGQSVRETSNGVETVVNCAPDISISKTGNTQVNSGGTVTYTVVVQNGGTDQATNVVISDDLPDAWTGVGGVWGPMDTACSVLATNNVSCSVGAIPAGGSVTVTITATVAGCDDFANTAVVTYGTGQASETSNTVTTVVDCAPDVSIAKTGTATVDSGGNVSYAITVTNNGTAEAASVLVTDDLPDNWTAVSAEWDPGDNACAVNPGNEVVCSIGSLAVGASVTVNIAATTVGCADFINVASVTYGPQGETVTTPSNEVSTVVQCASDIAIAKTGTASITTGGAVSYTITVENTGTGPEENVVITDDLPDGWTAVVGEWDPGDNPCSTGAGNVVACTVGDLASGGEVTMTITATATGCADFTNAASVAYGPEGQTLTETSNGVLTTVLCPNIGVEKTHAAGDLFLDTDEDFEWFIAITVSDGPATGTVVDALPSGFILESVNDGNVAGLVCSESPANTLVCELTAVANGTYQVVLSVQAPDGDPASECDEQVNTANVTEGGGITTSDDSDSDTVFITCPAISEEPSTTPTPGPTSTPTGGGGDGGDTDLPPLVSDVLGTQATPLPSATPQATPRPNATATSQPTRTSETLGVRELPRTGTGSEQPVSQSTTFGWITGLLVISAGFTLLIGSRIMQRKR